MTKPFLQYVTLTGADDSVLPDDLVTLADQYPFVEFGILMRESRPPIASPRFPSLTWLRSLAALSFQHLHLRLSVHLCGALMHDLMRGHWPLFTSDVGAMFQRYQINTHGVETVLHTLPFIDMVIEHARQGQRPIFQLDEVNTAGYLACIDHDIDAYGLFDLSHGSGQLPSKWPPPIPKLRCGYAGGLSPENVTGELALIELVCHSPSWIDAETHLRLALDQKFSLEKAAAFLAAARPWVIGQ